MAMIQDVDKWITDLQASGWARHATSGNTWVSPWGGWYRGPFHAWQIMKGECCAGCGHPQDWHRLDDSKNIPPTSPDAKFRCIGYDCERPGPPIKNGCDCPDFVEAGAM